MALHRRNDNATRANSSRLSHLASWRAERWYKNKQHKQHVRIYIALRPPMAW